AKKGYDLMVVGLERMIARREEFTDTVGTLAAGFEGPMILAEARGNHLKHPLQGKLSIMVPVNGTEISRRAAEVAIAVARAHKAPLTALYVAPGTAAKRPSRRYQEGILKDI